MFSQNLRDFFWRIKGVIVLLSKRIVFVSLLLLTMLIVSCAPASRYTTETKTTPRSRYYRTQSLTERFPPSNETFRTGRTYKWVTSYYGKDFHGKHTANGEIFDMNGLTCAHRELPFGTILKVTNPVTSESITVRVNDRGPYKRGRVLDLAQGAAEKIGMIDKGVKELHVEILHLPEFD